MQDRNEMRDLAIRALAHLDAGTTDQCSEIMRLPIKAYTDPETFKNNYDAIFLVKPLGLALSVELPEPETYVAKKILGKPLLFTRDKDGNVRLFFNVCRHRGAAVCTVGMGKATRFSCPYHAWTYDSAGRLVGMSGKNTFGIDETDSLGLVELPCAERAGIVWGALTPGIALNIDVWLGEFKAELETLELESWYLYDQRELPGPGWRATMDGYLEAYHHDNVHPETLSPHTIGNLLVHDTYGPHQRLTMARRNLAELKDIPKEEWNAIEHLRLIHSIFPNMSISGTLGDHCLVSQILPGDGPDSTVTIQTIMAAKKPVSEEEKEKTRSFSEMSRYAVAVEDYPIGNSIQNSICSGANDFFLIGRNELGIQHYQNGVEQYSQGS